MKCTDIYYLQMSHFLLHELKNPYVVLKIAIRLHRLGNINQHFSTLLFEMNKHYFTSHKTTLNTMFVDQQVGKLSIQIMTHT